MPESIGNAILQIIMLVAELSDAMACLLDLLCRHCDYNAEVVPDLEALARQTEDTLLAHQLLQEVHFIFKLGEVFDINAHHQVHGSLWHNWTQSRDMLQHLKGHFCVVLELFFKDSIVDQLVQC